MEKVIYLLWREAGTDADVFATRLRATLVRTLRAAGARDLQLNLADEDVKAAVGLRQACMQPGPDALVSLWLDSAAEPLRRGIDAAVAGCAVRHAGYRVVESQPLRNRRHPPHPGERTEGFAQIALLRRPPRLDAAHWRNIWLNSHTQVAIDTQSSFEYIQNLVVHALTDDAPAIDAIVEECFPAAAMSDYKVFFDAPGDEAKFRHNLQRMMDSVARFIEPGSLDVIPTSQYRLADAAT
ncbi:MAG TPA: hypothetical protein VLI06_18210 [Solimonas sp.]|nr:hypothetical protein [Solimonas sp.]